GLAVGRPKRRFSGFLSRYYRHNSSTRQGSAMRAFLLDGYGAIADHVKLADVADPVAGRGDVLIELHAASLNPIDFKIVRGDLRRVSKYRLSRTFGFDAS